MQHLPLAGRLQVQSSWSRLNGGCPIMSNHSGATYDANELLTLPLEDLLKRATSIRDHTYGTRITYSPKVFIPLTMLCRDKCGYCTFAQPPARLDHPSSGEDTQRAEGVA